MASVMGSISAAVSLRVERVECESGRSNAEGLDHGFLGLLGLRSGKLHQRCHYYGRQSHRCQAATEFSSAITPHAATGMD